MQYFWHTRETIPAGQGFSLFGTLHLVGLALFVAVLVACSLHYRRLGEKGRRAWRVCVAALLIADELFKQIGLIANGNWTADYLPLHLCSINIFLITLHTFRPSKALGNFLYTVCIPGAAAALLFPSWADLPLGNFMHLHSYTVHLLLVLYPVVLTAGGDIRPQWKQIPQCLGVLVCLAAVALVFNLALDTNFFFLSYAEAGNPLYWFDQNWGSHLLGFPVLVTAVLLVMHGPMALWHGSRRAKTAA